MKFILQETMVLEIEHIVVTGASGLWMVLALLMYLTRGIDWFNIDPADSRSAQAS